MEYFTKHINIHVDWGKNQDNCVVTVMKKNDNGILEVIGSKIIGRSESYSDKQREKYSKEVDKIIAEAANKIININNNIK